MDSNYHPQQPSSGSPQTNPSPLTNLPQELLLQILYQLPFKTLMILRGVSPIFAALVRKPSHEEWLYIETLPWACDDQLLACAGCSRLRHASKFSTKMQTGPPDLRWETTMRGGDGDFSVSFEPVVGRMMGPGGSLAATRFCNECGRREGEGEFRYKIGEVWDEEGVGWVRCKECEGVGMCSDGEVNGLCFRCNRKMVHKEDELRLAADRMKFGE